MQPVWDGYVARVCARDHAVQLRRRPIDRHTVPPVPNAVLMDGIGGIPVVLVVASDLRRDTR